jgi:hypothetical protein
MEQRVRETTRRTVEVMPELSVSMSDLVDKAVTGMGRTEDVVVSPDGRRLAVATINNDEIVILDFAVEFRPDDPTPRGVALTSAATIGCHSMARPHGVAWLDDDTLLVGNRQSEVLVLDISGVGALVDGQQHFAAEARVLLGGERRIQIDSPGSVVVRATDEELADIVVCNNYTHQVTRHVVDRVHDYACLDEDIIVEASSTSPTEPPSVGQVTGWRSATTTPTKCSSIATTSRSVSRASPTACSKGSTILTACASPPTAVTCL